MSKIAFNKTIRAKNVGVFINTLLLLVHIGLLIAFTLAHVWLMTVVNVLSILIYIGAFFVIYKGKIATYIAMAYTEILIHMMLAVLCVGWQFGFQLYCFSIIPTIYFEIYTKEDGHKYNRYAGIFATLIALIFVAIRIYTYYHPAIYVFGHPKLAIRCYIVNCCISFGILIYYLSSYTYIVIHSEKTLKLEADYDSLTGVYNRRRMQYLINELYNKAQSGKVAFSLSILDIDNFKGVNDTFGHDAGDFILTKISNLLTLSTNCSKTTTLVGRWGGEEFVIVQVYEDGEGQTERFLEELRLRVMHNRWMYNKREIAVTVTIGMTEYEGNKSVTELLREADQRLYRGKHDGKNRVVAS